MRVSMEVYAAAHRKPQQLVFHGPQATQQQVHVGGRGLAEKGGQEAGELEGKHAVLHRQGRRRVPQRLPLMRSLRDHGVQCGSAASMQSR